MLTTPANYNKLVIGGWLVRFDSIDAGDFNLTLNKRGIIVGLCGELVYFLSELASPNGHVFKWNADFCRKFNVWNKFKIN